jgi:hypothetical protein
MAWVQIQKAQEMGWEAYEQVARAVGADENPPDGLIIHAAGEQPNGKWLSVDVWESEAAYERFREERLMPAVRQMLGDEAADAGPPPQESFEAKHVVKP